MAKHEPDTASAFKESPVDRDRSDVYRPGEPAPPTPGFGHSAGSEGGGGRPG